MDLSGMSIDDLKLIQKQIIKLKVSQLTSEELNFLHIRVKKRLKMEPPLNIERIESTKIFFISGFEIKFHSEIIENVMKRYGEGKVDSHNNCDCFYFEFIKDEDANNCESYLDLIIAYLIRELY